MALQARDLAGFPSKLSHLGSNASLHRSRFNPALMSTISSRCSVPRSSSSPAPNSPICYLSVQELPASPPMPEPKRPGLPLEIVASPSGVSKLLLDGLPMLKQTYTPHPLIINRHQETILATLFRSLPKVTFRRQCLRMPDDGTVSLDWPVGGADCNIGPHQATQDGVPVLILLPGLAGGSGDTYVRHLLVHARKCGWNAVVFNSRGCADSPVTSAKFYSGGFTDDIRVVVKYLREHFPTSNLYAAGWSLGANILVRYIGEEEGNCLLTAAVSLCNPFDLFLSGQDLSKGFNNVYDKALARSLQKFIKDHRPLFEGIGGNYNIEKAANARTMREFHDAITIVSFGHKSVDDYYQVASSSRSIKDVRIPLFCIQAADDPIAPLYTTPRAAILDNGNCFLVVTPRGGHLGWLAGEGGVFGAPWTDPLVMSFFELVERSGKSGLMNDFRNDQSAV